MVILSQQSFGALLPMETFRLLKIRLLPMCFLHPQGEVGFEPLSFNWRWDLSKSSKPSISLTILAATETEWSRACCRFLHSMLSCVTWLCNFRMSSSISDSRS